MDTSRILTLSFCLLSWVSPVRGCARTSQGFFMATHRPEVGRKNDVYVYAINTDALANPGKVEFTKDSGLPSADCETGPIINGPLTVGSYTKISESKRNGALRYGDYKGRYVSEDNSMPDLFSTTFVKQPSKLLNTRGIYTVTVYPTAKGADTLDPPTTVIGVPPGPGNLKFRWWRGNARIRNSGPKYKVRSPDDGGLYCISRSGRGKRGWFVQIRVIVATCQRGFYNNGDGPDDCVEGRECLNGGVLKNDDDFCICPPFFVGDLCEYVVCPATFSASVLEFHVLFDSNELLDVLRCSDLPGGNPRCRGMLICYGDNYGCKCSPGWYGNSCDKPCRNGWYGASCEQHCPETDSDCNRFFGGEPTELSLLVPCFFQWLYYLNDENSK